MPKPWDATFWNMWPKLVVWAFEWYMYEISVGGNMWKHQHATFWNLAACILLWCNHFWGDNDVLCKCGEYKSCR